MDEASVVHVMLEWLKVCNTKAMEVIKRSMDEADAVHVMLEWLKVGNAMAIFKIHCLIHTPLNQLHSLSITFL
jgi:hypothetical protein